MFKRVASYLIVLLCAITAHADTTDTMIDSIGGLIGSIAIKAPVVIVSTTNLTLSGEQTVDGVALVEGDRVLVAGQTNAIQNGIYSVATGAWQRTRDFDGSRDATYGTLVGMQEGTYQSCMYQLQTESPDIGTDELSWVLHSCTNTIIIENTNTISGGSSNPDTGVEGDIFYNTTEQRVYIYRSDEWVAFVPDRKCIWFEIPTAADDFKTIWSAEKATTIISISCESDQTVNLDLQIDDGSPADVNGSDIACTSTWSIDETLAGDTTMAANDRLDLAIESVSGDPTWLSLCWGFK